MPTSSSMHAPVAVIDALGSLFDAEQNSIFRFMHDGSPYVSRASAELRKPLQEMVETSHRFSGELAALIDQLGGTIVSAGVQPEEQYLAFLAFKFLLPKLVEAKQLTIERYENAIRTMKDLPAGVRQVLESHVRTHRAQLAILERAAK